MLEVGFVRQTLRYDFQRLGKLLQTWRMVAHHFGGLDAGGRVTRVDLRQQRGLVAQDVVGAGAVLVVLAGVNAVFREVLGVLVHPVEHVLAPARNFNEPLKVFNTSAFGLVILVRDFLDGFYRDVLRRQGVHVLFNRVFVWHHCTLLVVLAFARASFRALFSGSLR